MQGIISVATDAGEDGVLQKGCGRDEKRNEGGMKCTVQDDIDVWPSAAFIVVGLVRILIRLQINVIIITFFIFIEQKL